MSKSPVYIGAGSSALTQVSAQNIIDNASDISLQLQTIEEWVALTDGTTVFDFVDNTQTTEYSAKEYAQGSTLAAGGSSKNWAQLATTPTTTATDASAKEWATGISTHKAEGSSKDWAAYTAGDVRGASAGSMSSKEWATGVQGRGVSGEGSSKDWATLPVSTGTVDDTSYSAKEYAQSTTAGTDTYDGSAKGWASTAYNTAIPGASASDRSSLHYSTLASNSATAAKASADTVASVIDYFDDKFLGSMSDSTSVTDSNTTGTWAINSSVITVASATNVIVGQEVIGASGEIPIDANVIAIDGTSVTISANMAAAGTDATLYFRGQGVYGDFNVSKDGPAATNDGGALADGMLYFNTTDDTMKVYNETAVKWKQLTPTSAEQTNIDAAVADSVDIGKVAAIDTEVGEVAAIDSEVVAVAGDAVDIGAVAAKATEIGRLGTADAVADMAILGSTTITDDMALLAIPDVIDDMETVANSIGDVNTFADIYQIDDFSPSAPTTDGGGNALAEGDMAYDSTANRLKVYDGSSFVGFTNDTEVTTAANNAAVAMSIALG